MKVIGEYGLSFLVMLTIKTACVVDWEEKRVYGELPLLSLARQYPWEVPTQKWTEVVEFVEKHPPERLPKGFVDQLPTPGDVVRALSE